MTTKLTLSIDPKIIEKAKLKAKQEGKSLSAMVEDYLAFSSLAVFDEKSDYADRVNKLAGSLKIDFPKNMTYKKMLQNALGEKYLKQK